ncbi:MAG: hypothetical protein QXI19_13860 [Candidatus Caldarchaeum sp.]
MAVPTLRVFINTSPKAIIPARVLAYSLLSRASSPVLIDYMDDDFWAAYPLEEKLNFGTYSALRRWLVPYRSSYSGYSLYLDADLLCLCDVQSLFSEVSATPRGLVDHLNNVLDPIVWCSFSEHPLAKKELWPEPSLLLFDCSRAESSWFFSPDNLLRTFSSLRKREEFQRYTHGLPILERIYAISRYWNCCGYYEPSRSRFVRYDGKARQPWVYPKAKLAQIWQAELAKAISSGFISRDLLEEEIQRFSPEGKSSSPRSSGPSGLHPFYKQMLSLVPKRSSP